MGGIGSAVRQCAGALVAAGHDVHVFTLGVPAEVRAGTPAGVNLHEAADLATRVQTGTVSAGTAAAINGGGEGVYRLAVGWLLCAAMLEEHRVTPFDVVEAPEVEALGLPLVLNDLVDVPVVTHLHCCSAIAQRGNEVAEDAPRRLINALEAAAIHLADAVCAPTEAVVRATRSFFAVREDVAIVPHAFGCREEAFVPPPVYGPMLFIGRIERLKGVDRIGGALNRVLAKFPKASLKFIGPDSDSAPGGGSMRRYIEANLSAEVAGRVTFAGELSHAQIERELAACSFCVQPSLWENFSMTCCEAFAAGRTVIVGKGTGSVALIGDAGVAVDPQSIEELAGAMETLLADRDRLVELSKRAHGRVRREFCGDVIAARRVAFYETTIGAFNRADRRARLETLPGNVAAAVLPALSALTGLLAGVHRSEASPGARLLAIMEEIGARRGAPAEVVLFGAGKHTARLLAEREVWEARGHRVVGLIDDHPRFAEMGWYLDLPVERLRIAEARLAARSGPPAVVLSTDTYQDQFWSQTAGLRAKGVEVFRLYSK
jgi:glycosyltransferase involved in cell wall biosynthesis